MKLIHICEVCGREEILDSEEAFEQGWDYPPKMGKFGVLSPRTCPNCNITDTVWWKLQNNLVDKITEKDLETIDRIIKEPESIMAE